MQLKILSVHNHGDFEKEHVLLEATADCDVGKYQLCDTTYSAKGNISNKLRHTFWIPDKLIKKGDLVSVWTKTGKDQEAKTDAGRTVHRFFWNLSTAVWNDDGDCAVLQHISAYQVFKARG